MPRAGRHVLDALQKWWEIAQIAGAGAALVLGPACLMLWRRHEKDVEYIRDSDKNTLRVLQELTAVLTKQDPDSHHRAVLEAITNAVATIKEHVDHRIGR